MHRAELKESASESAHKRRVEDLRNGAINAIANAVEGGGSGPKAKQRAKGPKQLSSSEDAADSAQGAWRLRSVAEVQEAEQHLNDELRQTQAQNSAILDRLAALKHAMEGTEVQHNHHLAGKVRYLLKCHARLVAQGE